MINLESFCHLICQWKILVLLTRVSRTKSVGGGGILTKITKNCMKIAKEVFFDKTVWGACQFVRGHQPDFRAICSMQEKICSTKQHAFHE